MAYTHLTKNELGWIETYYEIGLKTLDFPTLPLQAPIALK